MSEPRVLIIGAGMAGLTAAHRLREAGIDTVLLDKGRKPGGRMATRSIGGARFDHGAQHFGLRHRPFRAVAGEWMAAGLVREWFRAEQPAPDGSPNIRHNVPGGMRAVPEHLAGGLDVRSAVAVTRLQVSRGEVTAHSDNRPVAAGTAVIVTAPVPQTLELLDAGSLTVPGPVGTALRAIRYHACLAVMVRLDGPAGLENGHATPRAGSIAWIGDNEHKRVSPVPAVTIHSTPAFAAANLDGPVEEWTRALCEEAAPLLASPITDATGHRWRYAEPRTTLDIGAAVVAGAAPIVLAGEVFAGARIEGAFLSGREAARRLLELL